MYRRIIVPLDGSGLAEEALVQAEGLARLTGASLHLVRVVDYTHLEGYGPYAPLAVEYASAERVVANETAAATDYLREIQARLAGGGLAADYEVRRGRIAREVVDATRTGDVVVMASHGRSGVSRWLLGSVAEDVLRHATAPVLLVKVDAAQVPNGKAEPVGAAAAS